MTNTIANATLASVSETNRSRIMQHLYQHGISSRAQIAKALDLTPAAITKITAKLMKSLEYSYIVSCLCKVTCTGKS